MAIKIKQTTDPRTVIVRFEAPINEPLPPIPRHLAVIVMGTGTDEDWKQVCDHYKECRYVAWVSDKGTGVAYSNTPNVDKDWQWDEAPKSSRISV